MSNYLLETLEPNFGVKIANLIVNIIGATNVDWTVTSGRRTIAEQNNLYAQGRTKPGNIVTKAKGGQSPHNFGLAADLAPVKDGKPYWPEESHVFWKILGKETEKAGLVWGGNFKSILDLPHVEDPDWKQTQLAWKNGEIHVG